MENKYLTVNGNYLINIENLVQMFMLCIILLMITQINLQDMLILIVVNYLEFMVKVCKFYYFQSNSNNDLKINILFLKTAKSVFCVL